MKRCAGMSKSKPRSLNARRISSALSRGLPLALLLALAPPASAAACRAIEVEGAGYTLCEADARPMT